jgi:hypothetical protein
MELTTRQHRALAEALCDQKKNDPTVTHIGVLLARRHDPMLLLLFAAERSGAPSKPWVLGPAGSAALEQIDFPASIVKPATTLAGTPNFRAVIVGAIGTSGVEENHWKPLYICSSAGSEPLNSKVGYVW